MFGGNAARHGLLCRAAGPSVGVRFGDEDADAEGRTLWRRATIGGRVHAALTLLPRSWQTRSRSKKGDRSPTGMLWRGQRRLAANRKGRDASQAGSERDRAFGTKSIPQEVPNPWR